MGVKAAGRAGAVMKLILHDDVEGHDKKLSAGSLM